MPKYNGFSAWIHVQGQAKPLEELDVQVKSVKGSPEVSCFIPAIEDKKFKVFWRDDVHRKGEHGSTLGELFMDGRMIADRFIVPGKDNKYHRTKNTAVVGGFYTETGTHPFVFKKADLSDDESLLAWSEVDQKIGEIRIVIQGIYNLTGRDPNPPSPAEKRKQRKEAKAQEAKAVPNMGGNIHESVKPIHYGYRIGLLDPTPMSPPKSSGLCGAGKGSSVIKGSEAPSSLAPPSTYNTGGPSSVHVPKPKATTRKRRETWTWYTQRNKGRPFVTFVFLYRSPESLKALKKSGQAQQLDHPVRPTRPVRRAVTAGTGQREDSFISDESDWEEGDEDTYEDTDEEGSESSLDFDGSKWWTQSSDCEPSENEGPDYSPSSDIDVSKEHEGEKAGSRAGSMDSFYSSQTGVCTARHGDTPAPEDRDREPTPHQGDFTENAIGAASANGGLEEPSIDQRASANELRCPILETQTMPPNPIQPAAAAPSPEPDITTKACDSPFHLVFNDVASVHDEAPSRLISSEPSQNVPEIQVSEMATSPMAPPPAIEAAANETIQKEPESGPDAQSVDQLVDDDPPDAIAEKNLRMDVDVKQEEPDQGLQVVSNAISHEAEEAVGSDFQRILEARLQKERNQLDGLEMKQLASHEKLKLFQVLATTSSEGNVIRQQPLKRTRLAEHGSGSVRVKREEVETVLALSHPRPAEPTGYREAVERRIEGVRKEIVLQEKDIEHLKRSISALELLVVDCVKREDPSIGMGSPACIDLTGDDD